MGAENAIKGANSGQECWACNKKNKTLADRKVKEGEWQSNLGGMGLRLDGLVLSPVENSPASAASSLTAPAPPKLIFLSFGTRTLVQNFADKAAGEIRTRIWGDRDGDRETGDKNALDYALAAKALFNILAKEYKIFPTLGVNFVNSRRGMHGDAASEHIGSNTAILTELLTQRRGALKRFIREDLVPFERRWGQVGPGAVGVLAFWCNAGQHRSVALKTFSQQYMVASGNDSPTKH